MRSDSGGTCIRLDRLGSCMRWNSVEVVFAWDGCGACFHLKIAKFVERKTTRTLFCFARGGAYCICSILKTDLVSASKIMESVSFWKRVRLCHAGKGAELASVRKAWGTCIRLEKCCVCVGLGNEFVPAWKEAQLVSVSYGAELVSDWVRAVLVPAGNGSCPCMRSDSGGTCIGLARIGTCTRCENSWNLHALGTGAQIVSIWKSELFVCAYTERTLY